MNPLITGVRNLPKIEKKGSKPGSRKLSKDGGASGGSDAAAGVAAASEDTEVKNFIEPAMFFFSLGGFCSVFSMQRSAFKRPCPFERKVFV